MYNCAKYEKIQKKKQKQKRLPFEKIQVTMTQLLALETSVPKILNESSKICETILRILRKIMTLLFTDRQEFCFLCVHMCKISDFYDKTCSQEDCTQIMPMTATPTTHIHDNIGFLACLSNGPKLIELIQILELLHNNFAIKTMIIH